MYTQLVALLGLLVSFTLATCNDVTTKRITTQDGTGYTYDYVPAQQGKSTLLLIHGFPSTRHDWHNQVADLSAAGYGVLVPDCLGYGDSDMPLEVQAYNMKRMVGHLTEMLDEESLDTVIGVGHDWGSSILSRMAIWHRDRLDKLAFLSVGYLAPGTLLDIDAINAAAVETYGYAQYGYFYFFYNYDSGAIARDHLSSFFNLLFPTNTSAWDRDFATLGAARSWLNANTTTPPPAYLTEKDIDVWMTAFSQPNATEASINYYKSLMYGVQAVDEENFTDEDRMLTVPVLAVGGTEDLVTRLDQLEGQLKPWTPNGFTLRTLETSHWMMWEDPEGLSSILLEFAAE